MAPVKHELELDVSAPRVMAKIGHTKALQVPDGCTFVAGAVDLNTSFGATVAVVAFKPDTSSTVIWHHVYPCSID